MAHSPLYKGSLTLRPRHAFLQPRDQDLMKLGSRGQTLRPGIHASAGHDHEQLGGGGGGRRGHDQENPERGHREEFQGDLCFFP